MPGARAGLCSVLLGAALLAAIPGGRAAAAGAAALPAQVTAALEQAHVAEANRAFVVVPLDGGPLQLALQGSVPMNPASTMKLLTTFAALSTLGPNYHWHTEALSRHAPSGGRLDGDLIIRGSGDPSLVVERWWLFVERLRALGIREIRGNLVIDRSGYALPVDASGSIDGNELRPYNVAPDALLVNFKTVGFTFTPLAGAGSARVAVLPPLDGMKPIAPPRLAGGPCGDWKGRLQADFSHPLAPAFHGSYPRACGEKTWYVSLLSPDNYALASFRALWRTAGGVFHGGVRDGVAGAGDIVLVDQESPPLAEVIRDINKNSNNVMARQLFLSLGAAPAEPLRGGTAGEHATPAPAEPASTARSARVVQAWLDREGMPMPELVLQNGSGLSRQERISAGGLARLLVRAWHSNEMPNFLASLPMAGVDGTMKDRPGASGAAYVKTGTLAEVRALAGYVFAASGHRYVVVALINDAHAEAAQDAHDLFLEWVFREG